MPLNSSWRPEKLPSPLQYLARAMTSWALECSVFISRVLGPYSVLDHPPSPTRDLCHRPLPVYLEGTGVNLSPPRPDRTRALPRNWADSPLPANPRSDFFSFSSLFEECLCPKSDSGSIVMRMCRLNLLFFCFSVYKQSIFLSLLRTSRISCVRGLPSRTRAVRAHLVA